MDIRKLELIDVYYRQHEEIPEYMQIIFQTSLALLKYNITAIGLADQQELKGMIRLEEMDRFKKRIGKLYINEVRITYDNDMYLLLSDKIILAIEYVLNSDFDHNVQEFSVIEDIHGLNNAKLVHVKSLDIVKLPV